MSRFGRGRPPGATLVRGARAQTIAKTTSDTWQWLDWTQRTGSISTTINASAGDGYLAGYGTSWATTRALTTSTDAALGTGTSGFGVFLEKLTGDANFYLYRGYLPFSLATVPAGVQLASATVYVYVTAKQATLGGALWLVTSTQASITTLADTDYNDLSTTAASDYKPNFADIPTGGYLGFPLNAAGLAAMTTGSSVKLGFRHSNDVLDSQPGSNAGSDSITINFSENASNKPYIAVTYDNVRTATDSWAWSDAADITAKSGNTIRTYSRTASNTWAWSDSVGVYWRGTGEITVTDQGPNTFLNDNNNSTFNLSGASTIPADDTSAFAVPGTAYVINNGTSNQQQGVFTYTNKTPTSFTGVSFGSLIGSTTFASGSGIGAPNAESHFPRLTRLDETSRPPLMCSYHQHGGHSVLRGKLAYKISTDGGLTWGTEQYIVSSPANGSSYGVFGHCVLRLKNGRLFATWYEHQMDYTSAGSTYQVKQMCCYSDDSAVSWSSPVQIPLNYGFSNNDASGSTGSGLLLDTGSGSNSTYGDIYMTVTGNDDHIQVHGSAPLYRWYSKLYKITDGGASGTATLVSTIATTTDTGGFANAEVDICVAENGTWIAHLRVEEANYSRWQAVSTDKGVTWTGHAHVLDIGNAGVLTKLPGGTLISTGAPRTVSDGTVSYWSTDNGATWQPGVKVEAANATYTAYNGADAEVIIDDPGTLVNTAFTYSQERSSQTGARVMFRWYTDPVKRTVDTWAWTDTAVGTRTWSRTATDTWAWTDTNTKSQGKSRATTDSWAWSETVSTFVQGRSTGDIWVWTDTNTRRLPASFRTATNTWAWADAVTYTLSTSGVVWIRGTSDAWAWSDTTSPATPTTTRDTYASFTGVSLTTAVFESPTSTASFDRTTELPEAVTLFVSGGGFSTGGGTDTIDSGDPGTEPADSYDGGGP